MLSSTIRRSLLSLLAVSTVGTLGFSAAASLGEVTSEQLGAGDEGVSACTDEGISIDWQTEYSSDIPGFALSAFDLSGDGLAACNGYDLQLAVAGPAGSPAIATVRQEGISPSSGELTVTLASATSVDIDDSYGYSAIAAEDIHHVALVIAGTPAT